MGANNDKSLETWIWDAACSIRGRRTRRSTRTSSSRSSSPSGSATSSTTSLNRIAEEVGSRAKAFELVEKDHKLVRFYLPLTSPPTRTSRSGRVIRKLIRQDRRDA